MRPLTVAKLLWPRPVTASKTRRGHRADRPSEDIATVSSLPVTTVHNRNQLLTRILTYPTNTGRMLSRWTTCSDAQIADPLQAKQYMRRGSVCWHQPRGNIGGVESVGFRHHTQWFAGPQNQVSENLINSSARDCRGRPRPLPDISSGVTSAWRHRLSFGGRATLYLLGMLFRSASLPK